MADYVLPPLKPRPTYHWLEANFMKWREDVEKGHTASKSFFARVGYGLTHWFLNREIRSGRKQPWMLRFWYFLGRIILSSFGSKPDNQVTKLMRRAFDRGTPDSKFYGSYVVMNFVTGIFAFIIVPIFLLPYAVESAYIIGSYRHDKYKNVTITSHYRDFDAGPHIFAVHGLIDGNPKDELFIQIGPSFWFQEYNPENIFGKVSDGAVCDFSGYGWLIRMPLGLRYLSGGSLYALNPWAVDATCHKPSAA